MQDEPLSKRLLAMRAAANISQRRLAELGGVKDGTVINWMDGLGVRESKLRQFASRTGVDYEWLMFGTGNEDEQLRRFLEKIASQSPGGARSKLQAAVFLSGKSPALLAKEMGYDSGVIESVVNGASRASEAMIERFVECLPDLSKEDLMEGSDSPAIIQEGGREATYGSKASLVLPPGVKGRYVPLLSAAQAGEWDAGHTDEGYSYVSVLALNVDDRRAFAITVRGNSMEPELYDGDVVVCSPEKPVHNGECAVIRTRSSQAFIKFWHRHADRVELKSANPDHPPLNFALSEIIGAWPVIQRTSSGTIKRQL